MCLSKRERQTVKWKRRLTASDANEYWAFLRFCFPSNNSHLRRDTLQLYSECVNGFSSLHSFCMNGNNWMTCSLNAACRQVGSFNSTRHNTCFVFLPERFRAPCWTHHSSNRKRFFAFLFRRKIFNCHFLTRRIFTCRASTATSIQTDLIVIITNDNEATKTATKERFWSFFGQCLQNAGLHSFTFCTWRVPASHIYFISPDS